MNDTLTCALRKKRVRAMSMCMDTDVINSIPTRQLDLVDMDMINSIPTRPFDLATLAELSRDELQRHRWNAAGCDDSAGCNGLPGRDEVPGCDEVPGRNEVPGRDKSRPYRKSVD